MSIVLIGAGEMGYHLARRLSYEKQAVTLVDKNKDRISLVEETLDVRTVHGRGSSPLVLKRAGVEKASMLVAVTDSDEVNLVACFVAGQLNQVMKKVARVRQEDYQLAPQIFDETHLGIDLVISPETEAVNKILKVLEAPNATDVMDFADGRIKMMGIRLESDSPLVGRSLMSVGEEYQDDKFLVTAVFRESEVIIPRGPDTLRTHDVMYVMAPAQSVNRVMEIAGLRPQPMKRFMILGGTTVGVQLAKELERKGYANITLIERNPARCEEIAEELDATMVLRSEAVDEPFLRSEGVAHVDFFMALTENDENNALIAMLAKRMGASRVAALTNKVDYHRLLSAVGLDVLVNPRLAGASRILQYIRKGNVISVSMLPGEEVEAIELEAMETSQLVGRPLRKLKFPAGAILGSVERGREFLIANGNTMIQPGDRIVFFAKREAIPKLERLVTVGLSYF